MQNSISSKQLMHTALRSLLFAVLSLIAIGSSNAQGTADGQTPLGIAPGAPAGSYALSNFDNVNLFNGNLNFSLPLVNIAGRGGAGYTSLLVIERKWTVNQETNDQTHQTTYFPSPASWEGIRPGYGPGVLQGRRGGTGNVAACSVRLYTQTLTRLTFTAPDGTEYELHDQLTDGQPRNPAQCTGAGFSRGKIFITADGTAATFISDTDILDAYRISNQEIPFYPSGYLLMRDGTRYRIDNGLVSWQRDRNGNQLNFTYNDNKLLTSVTDSLNRTVTFAYGVTDLSPYGLCNQITFKGFGGASRTVKISIAQLGSTTTLGPVLRAGYTIQTEKQLFPELNGARSTVLFNPNVVSALWLPDSDGVLRHYKFSYNSYGELARVDLPTGGAVEYDYATGLTDGNPSGVISNISARRAIYRRIVERRVYADGSSLDSRTTYSRPETTTTNLGYVRTEQYDRGGARLGRQDHYFYGGARPSFGSNPIGYASWQDGREYQIDVFDSDGATLLRRTVNTWQQPTAGNSWPLTQDETNSLAKPNNPQVTETISTLADTTPNLISRQTFDYDKYSNRTDVYEYDYGPNAASALQRRTHIDYVISPDYTDVTGAHLRSLPIQQWISSDAGGINKVSLTDYEYDNYATDTLHAPLVDRPDITGLDTTFTSGYILRGNVTKITRYADAATQGQPIASAIQYDVAGNAVKAIDGRGNDSEISYSAANQYAAPTSKILPVPDPTGQNGSTSRFVTTTNYDFWTGLVTSTTDVNGQVISYDYNDSLNRLTRLIRADGGQTIYTYGDTVGSLNIRSQTQLDSSHWLDAYQYFDGLGRATRSFSYDGTANTPWITTDTYYDALGRVSKGSNPYRVDMTEAPLPTICTICTVSEYDTLGRVTKVTTPDGAHLDTIYRGNMVTVTDQAGKQRRSVTDAMGRLSNVVEDPGGLNYQTDYLYDALGMLRQVTQGAQIRYFMYDSLSRLVRARNPEQQVNTALSLSDPVTNNSQWSMAYVYDANGNLVTRTDARNLSTNYSYDGLNRITKRAYCSLPNQCTDPTNTPTVVYRYDTPGITNAKGQLTSISAVITSSGSPTPTVISMTNYAGFDALGRVTDSSQITNGQTYSMSYEYDLAGNLRSEHYPSGRIIQHSFDAAGRLAGVSGTKGTASMLYASAISYAPHGAVQELRLGNGPNGAGLWEHTDFNHRLQPVEIGLGTTQHGTDRLKLNYNYGTTNNAGDVQNQIITVPGLSPLVQTYTYDSLGRLKSAKETGGTGTNLWTQAFIYDDTPNGQQGGRYGNRRIDPTLTTANVLPISNPTFDLTTSRIAANQGYSYDAAGNITGAPSYSYEFDAENRMVTAYDNNPNPNRYVYDGDGRRVKKVTANGQETTVFVYNAMGQMVAEYNNLPSSTANDISYLTSDTLGTPRVITKADGSVQARHDYLPFGEKISADVSGRSAQQGYVSSNVKQKFGKDYVRDDETGLDYAKARYYSSTQGRFISIDPIISSADPTKPQSWDRYTYCLNNPLKYVDPSGLIWVWQDNIKNGQTIRSFWWIPDEWHFVPKGWNVYKGSPYFIGTDEGLFLGANGHVHRISREEAANGQIEEFLRGPHSPLSEEQRAELERAFARRMLNEHWEIEASSAILGSTLGSLSEATLKGLAGLILSHGLRDTETALLSGMLREAAAGKGNFGIGSATVEQAEAMGRAWVGEGYTIASDGKTLLSADKLRQFRPPAFKPGNVGSSYGPVQANLEWRVQPSGQWQGNAHIDISP